MDLARRVALLEAVPKVFAYGKIEQDVSVRWIVQELKPGEPLSGAWDGLSLSNKEILLTQIARIFTALQSCKLPETVRGFGGLQYNDAVEVVSGAIVFGFGGPYATLEDMYFGMFKRQLELADSCSVCNGWGSSKKGLRLRQSLEKFVNEGLSSTLAKVSNKTLTLTHGDFDIHNILFDKNSMAITALLDFDFAHIASPIDEYLYSFQSMSSILIGAHEKGKMGKLQQYILTGVKPERLPPNSRIIDWNVGVAWNEAVKTAGGVRPSDVEGAAILAEMKWFMEAIRPPYFAMPRWLARRTPEQIETERKKVEADLEKRLKRAGYFA